MTRISGTTALDGGDRTGAVAALNAEPGRNLLLSGGVVRPGRTFDARVALLRLRARLSDAGPGR